MAQEKAWKKKGRIGWTRGKLTKAWSPRVRGTAERDTERYPEAVSIPFYATRSIF